MRWLHYYKCKQPCNNSKKRFSQISDSYPIFVSEKRPIKQISYLWSFVQSTMFHSTLSFKHSVIFIYNNFYKSPMKLTVHSNCDYGGFFIKGKFYSIVIEFFTSSIPTLTYKKFTICQSSLKNVPLDGEKNLSKYLYILFSLYRSFVLGLNLSGSGNSNKF